MLSAAAAGAQPRDQRGTSHEPRATSNERRATGSDVEVQATIDRNAVWVADRFTYTVQLTCRRGVDILADDLSREKLRLDGPDVLSVDTTHEDRGDGVTLYRVAYHLTTYRLEPPTQKIGGLTVRYYVKRPGQRLEDIAPAGDVAVPGAVVAVRSLLPDEQESAAFRDVRSPLPRRPLFAMLEPLGIALVVVSIVPVVVWGTVLVGRARRRKARRSARQVRHEERESLDTLRAIDLTTEAGRREAYDRVSALVRLHLRDACGVPADGLTAAEIGPALALRRKDAPVDLVTSLLTACEEARYGRAGSAGSAESCRAAIEQAEQVIATAR